MKYDSEEKVLNALDIKSWENLPQEKFVQFSSMLPEMDNSVAIKILEKAPEIMKHSIEALNILEKEYANTTENNRLSQSEVHKAYQEAREIFKSELKSTSLDSEKRERLYGLVMETADKESEKDSENKKFLADLFKGAVIVTGVVAISLVLITGKVSISKVKSIL